MQLRFLVRCDEDDAIDELAVVAAPPMAVVVVENVNSTMMSSDYEDSARISLLAAREMNGNQINTNMNNNSWRKMKLFVNKSMMRKEPVQVDLMEIES